MSTKTGRNLFYPKLILCVSLGTWAMYWKVSLCCKVDPYYLPLILIKEKKKKSGVPRLEQDFLVSLRLLRVESEWGERHNVKFGSPHSCGKSKDKRLCRDLKVSGEIKSLLMFVMSFSGTAFSWHGAAHFCTVRLFDPTKRSGQVQCIFWEWSLAVLALVMYLWFVGYNLGQHRAKRATIPAV